MNQNTFQLQITIFTYLKENHKMFLKMFKMVKTCKCVSLIGLNSIWCQTILIIASIQLEETGNNRILLSREAAIRT